ncbi:G-protein coupled receptor family C group 5 member C [Folsomia candida]|uniref:G-protein coupled receptor family C group 5 member C n=1 Tax=Folsomia candida TaxID=158441 RepID=A0A226DKJ9_FOLCA|nr:G-protein coupled receptor family C group 5 member C [Folsomia candida]
MTFSPSKSMVEWPPGRRGRKVVSILLLFGLLWGNVSAHLQSAKLGVLVDLHEPISGDRNADRKSVCGPLNVHSYQKLSAVQWAVEIINNNSYPGEFSLDLLVHDTCGESGIASSEAARLIKWSKDNPQTPLIGVIVIGSLNNERIIDSPLENLNNENISAIVTFSKAAGLMLTNHSNVFTTAPDLSGVTEGIVALINQLGAQNVAIISSSAQAIKKFQRLATPLSINAKSAFLIQKDNLPTLMDIVKFLEGQASTVQSVIMLLESTELESLVGDSDAQSVERFQKLVGQKSWILGSVGMDNDLVKDWSSKFQVNLLTMQPRTLINSEFHSYFVDKLMATMPSNGNKEAVQYMESMYHCQDSKTNKKRLNNPLIPQCSSLTRTMLLKKLHPESDIGFIVNAVSAYSAALRLAQLSCNNATSSNSTDNSDLSDEVLAALRSLNLPAKDVEEQDASDSTTESTVSSSHEIEGTQRRINYYGKLINGLVLDVMVGVKLEGGTSMQDGVVEGTEATVNVEKPGATKISMRRGKTAKTGGQEKLLGEGRTTDMAAVNVRRMMSPPELYISRMWAMIATAVSITGVFISLYMLVYVLQRMCDGTLRGNQILGILLLLGIIMIYSSVVLFVLPPGSVLCNFKVFLPSIATATCFGILMLKAMQLRSLVSLGLGGRVPALNQFVTLLFIVAVQVAVNVQWFFGPHEETFPTRVEVMSSGSYKQPLIQECFYSHHSFLYLHSYLGVLISVVFVYGLSITLASCLSLPIAVAWAIVVQVGPANFQEPAACAAFITTATVLLFSIFIPKLNTISQQSKVAKRKQQQQQTLKPGSGGEGPPPGYGGSISTIFTTLSDRGTLQSQFSQKRGSPQKQQQHFPPHHNIQYPPHQNVNHHNLYVPPPPLPPLISSSNGKSVTYSPRLTTNFYHSSSTATSLARSASMKTPFFGDSGRTGYP